MERKEPSLLKEDSNKSDAPALVVLSVLAVMAFSLTVFGLAADQWMHTKIASEHVYLGETLEVNGTSPVVFYDVFADIGHTKTKGDLVTLVTLHQADIDGLAGVDTTTPRGRIILASSEMSNTEFLGSAHAGMVTTGFSLAIVSLVGIVAQTVGFWLPARTHGFATLIVGLSTVFLCMSCIAVGGSFEGTKSQHDSIVISLDEPDYEETISLSIEAGDTVWAIVGAIGCQTLSMAVMIWGPAYGYLTS